LEDCGAPKPCKRVTLPPAEVKRIIGRIAPDGRAGAIDLTFGNLVIDSSFLFARRNGVELKFTRSERALLRKFTQHVREVLTRDQLLDAVAGVGADVSDRNIDYLINRLRAKLGDSARNPSLIGTQYGEGYIWLAEPGPRQQPIDALLVIGPVFGLKHLANAAPARSVLRHLQTALDAQTAGDRPVLLDETWSRSDSPPGHAQFSLDVSLHAEGTNLHCALVLRETASGQMLQVIRLAVSGDSGEARQRDIRAVAETLKSTMWRRLTFGPGPQPAPQEEPLEVRMHRAGLLLSRSGRSWLEAGAQLAQERETNPDDPQTCLMWATYLYTRILLVGPSEHFTIEACDTAMAEIEALVLDRLTAFQDDPIHLLGAAKLLLFTGRGHVELAAELAERAFASSAAFAAAFSVLGQIRMCMGNPGAALDLYEKGIELSKPGSEFHVYLMVLRLNALAAAGRWSDLDAACAELYTLKPATRLGIGLFYAQPGALPADLKLVRDGLSAAQARGLVSYVYCMSARLFERPEHRENMLRGVVWHAVSRFGASVVPDQVWRSAPALARDHGAGLAAPEYGGPA